MQLVFQGLEGRSKEASGPEGRTKRWRESLAVCVHSLANRTRSEKGIAGRGQITNT